MSLPRLIVVSTFDHRRNYRHDYPHDIVVVAGQSLHGIRVREIVDETFMPVSAEWWDHAKTRLVAIDQEDT